MCVEQAPQPESGYINGTNRQVQGTVYLNGNSYKYDFNNPNNVIVEKNYYHNILSRIIEGQELIKDSFKSNSFYLLLFMMLK